MKNVKLTTRWSIAFSAAMLLVSNADAQLPGVNLNQSASSAASTTQRVRAQVQQRVQAQVQQQVQAQTQQRIQFQTRLRLPATNAIRINAGAKARVDAGAGVRVGAASGQSEAGQTARGGIGVGIPVTVSAEEMANLDVVFGDFNPFRQSDRDDRGPDSETAPDSPNETGDATPDETPDSDSGDQTDSDQPRRRRPIRLVFQSDAEFQASVTAAVRQRRADISAMRDRAVAEADTRMMAQADRMEAMMDAYVAAEAKANANANSAINTSPFTRRRDSAVIKAGAETEARGRAKVFVPGRSQEPAEPTP